MKISGLNELEQLRDAVLKFGEVMTNQLSELFEQLQPTIQSIYDAIWQAYRDVGMPYGETNEGLWRWVREIGEAHRMKVEAERILSHHQILANFRVRVSNEN